MKTPEQMKLARFSLEEYERYGILDEEGCIIGVKEDAPNEFKAAYAADKETSERWAALGID